MSNLRRHFSPALVIALIALFVSLGGVSYGVATGFIDSRELKDNTVRTRDLRNNDVRTRDVRNNELRTIDLRNNEVRGVDLRNSTVQGRDVALNTLTGDDINESRLGKVSSATSADSASQANSATTADSAQSLNGLRVVPVKHRSGNVGGQTILDAGGLQLIVSCVGGDEELLARTTVAGSEIAVVSNSAVAMNATAGELSHNVDDAFNPGEDFDLQTDAALTDDDRIFQLHYLAGNGADVTAHLIADDDLGASNCVVSGYAVVVG
jgi:hypothetical protein